jgi:hypothetical protein
MEKSVTVSTGPIPELPRHVTDADPTPWKAARERLTRAESYWLTTLRPDGSPHVVPCWAVWLDDVLYTTASSSARRGRHVAYHPTAVVSAATPGFDLVVQGTIAKVHDEAVLARVGTAYDEKYGWPLTIKNGAYDAPYAAATAGPAPYELYRVQPTIVFGFPNDATFVPTRWRF